MDLGSNSFHLVVADVRPDGTFAPTIREKEMLHLGEDVTRLGEIPKASADAAVAAIRRFRKLAEAAGADEIHAKATSAIRSAANGPALVDRIEAEAGVVVDVIDGLEEARLIFTAIRAAVVLDPGPAICFDLGGGSLEIAVGDNTGLQFAASERLGVGRLTAMYAEQDPLSDASRRSMREHCISLLSPIAEQVKELGALLAVGSSGSFEAIAAMVAATKGGGAPSSLNQYSFTFEDFLPLYRTITRSSQSERRAIPGMDSKRVDLIAAGAVVLRSIFEVFDLKSMTISDWALREGIVLNAIAQHEPEEWTGELQSIRRGSVLGLARRCSWPEAHSLHVSKLALQCFDTTRDIHGLDLLDRELLEYAAILHDIGEHVAHEGHEKHAAYLVRNGELRGFSPAEITMLVALVRWHRRGEVRSDSRTGDLDRYALQKCRILTGLLRIADGLDRSRHQIVTDIQVSSNPSLILFRLSTRLDPELEIWGARRKRGVLEATLGRDVEFTAHPARREAAS
jgi:exopolyphosphatase / guanosine-5'-triphosphate,3'-diphosphate pyrophosphatase